MSQFDDKYIAELSHRFLNGMATEEEKRMLLAWFESDAENKPEWVLKNENKEALKERIYSSLQKRIKDNAKSRLVSFSFWRIAAMLLVFLSLGLIWYTQFYKQDNLIVQGNARGVRKVILPDNSLVWLKGNSSLEYPEHFTDSTRKVTLVGEALFEVAKDKKHPFIITSGKYLTRVLGTSFNIKHNIDNGSFKLTVLTGKVQLTTPSINFQTSQKVYVTPGKELELKDGEVSPVWTKTNLKEKESVVQGTEYIMSFQSTSFREIVKRIENKFNIEMDADSIDYKSCKISADLTDQSLENTLKVICASIGADYSIQKNKVKISGGGCN